MNPKTRTSMGAGWPDWLEHLSDSILNGLPAGEQAQFRAELRARVPACSSLEAVRHATAAARLGRLLTDSVVQSDSAMIEAFEKLRARHQEASRVFAPWPLPAPAALSFPEYVAEWVAAGWGSLFASWSTRTPVEWEDAWKAERDALYAALANVGGAA